MTTLRVAVVDDEPLARLQLRRHLGEVPWVTLVGEAADGPAAVRLLDEQRPDVVLLDVALPGCTGLEVLERLERVPAVLFTTAFGDWALRAFELQAVDYLLKPFGRDRLLAALARVRAAFEHGAAADGLTRAALALAPPRGPERLFASGARGVEAVRLDEVECVEARDDYVAVYSGGRRLLVKARMRDLEARLDPARFMRIHRSWIVRLAAVERLVTVDAKRVAVILKGGLRLEASRSRTPGLRKAFR